MKEAPGQEESEALGGKKKGGGRGQEERMTRGWDGAEPVPVSVGKELEKQGNGESRERKEPH